MLSMAAFDKSEPWPLRTFAAYSDSAGRQAPLPVTRESRCLDAPPQTNFPGRSMNFIGDWRSPLPALLRAVAIPNAASICVLLARTASVQTLGQ